MVGLSLAVAGYGSMHASMAYAYTIDKVNHIITVAPSGDYTSDARRAVDFLVHRPDKDVTWNLKFEPGKYYLTQPLYSVGLQNVNVLSNPSNPAQLIKAPKFPQDYIFYTRMSKNVTVRGFEFFGNTNFQKNINPVWADQGIYFGSCNNVTVDNNKFYNFGNCALRVTTSEADPVKGVNSFNTKVTNNTFNNVYQIATTSNDTVHGATASYTLANNTFVNLRGSVKFASRTEGAQDIHVLSNTINGGDHFGLEIDNYNNFEIRGNTFENIKSVAVNIYTAGDKKTVPKRFPWGNNFTIADNIIRSCGRGIRFSHEPFYDGFQYVPHSLVVDNNTINNLTEPNKEVAAIQIIRGKIDGVKLTKNKMASVASKKYISLEKGCTNVTQGGNVADGVNLDAGVSGGGTSVSASAGKPSSSPPPPSTASAGSPAAPSNLAGQYDGNLMVHLTWKDNANNESAEEIWGSNDGKKYSLIARLYANSVEFTHRLRKIPAATYFYYVVKSVNSSGASGYSNAYRVTFHAEKTASTSP
jgi:hypothetical protein